MFLNMIGNNNSSKLIKKKIDPKFINLKPDK